MSKIFSCRLHVAALADCGSLRCDWSTDSAVRAHWLKEMVNALTCYWERRLQFLTSSQVLDLTALGVHSIVNWLLVLDLLLLLVLVGLGLLSPVGSSAPSLPAGTYLQV